MTLKDYKDRPETRVFRLDTECYIIYLGDNGNDYKPFLRIGNTQDLPQTVIANTQNIVITDRLTGNPALETANIYDMYLDEIRYLGDPDLVEHFHTFVRKANLHVQAFDAYTGQEESKANASFVYFYTDGNMSVYFGRNKIFNLRDRERIDTHFIERAKRIRSQFIKNQLRYRSEDFRGPGFIIVDGALNYFLNGQIIAPALSDTFFANFARAGVDPDQIHMVYSDALSESLLDLFKRKRSKQDPVVVITTNPELVTTAAELFSIKKQEALDARIVDFSSGSCEIDDLVLRRTNGALAASFKGLDITLQPGATGTSAGTERRATEEQVLAVDPRSGETSLQRGRRTFSTTVLTNTPHSVRSAVPDAQTLVHRYFETTLPFYTGILRPESGQIVAAVNGAVNELLQGKDGNAFKQADSRLRDLDGPVEPFLRNFLITAQSAFRMMRNGEGGVASNRSAGVLATAIGRALPSPAPAELPEYFVGELCVGKEDVYLFYRPAKINVTPNQIETAAVVARKIDDESAVDRATFASERERLFALLQELDIPHTRQGPGPAQAAEEQRRDERREAGEEALRRSAAEAEQRRAAAQAGTKAPEKPAAAAAARRDAAPRSAAASGPMTTGPTTPVLTRSSTSSRRRWGLPVGIAVAVVVLAGALLFLLLRTGRGTGSSTSVASGTGAGRAQTESTAVPGSTQSGQNGSQGASAGTGGPSAAGATGLAGPGQGGGTGTTGAAGSSGAGAAGTGGGASSTAPAGAGATGASGGVSGGGTGASSGAAGAAGTGGAQGETGQRSTAQEPTASAGAAAGAAQGSTSTAGPAAGAAQPGPATGGVPGATTGGFDLNTGLYVHGILITSNDIQQAADAIARRNGFQPVPSAMLSSRQNPAWVVAGKTLMMPDGRRYTVADGNSVYSIALNYIRATLEDALRRYHELLMAYGLENRIAPPVYEKKAELIVKLRNLEEGVYSENFGRMVEGMINELKSTKNL